jgi:hypothetical protein
MQLYLGPTTIAVTYSFQKYNFYQHSVDLTFHSFRMHGHSKDIGITCYHATACYGNALNTVKQNWHNPTDRKVGY